MSEDARILPFPHRRRRATRAGCPICGKPAVADHDPFCSARCKQIDLGRWLNGTYRIETEEKPDEPAPEGGERSDG